MENKLTKKILEAVSSIIDETGEKYSVGLNIREDALKDWKGKAIAQQDIVEITFTKSI